MHIAVIVVGQSKSYFIKVENKDSYYWGPDEEMAHGFISEDEALKKARKSLPDNIAHNITSKLA